MSNRRRREETQCARMKEIVQAGLSEDLRQQLKTLPERVGDTRGAVRLVFGWVSRRPLEFRSSSKRGDSFDRGLERLQGLNAPAGFDLLRGDLDDVLVRVESCRLRSDYQDDLESVCSVFEQSREILAPLRRVNLLARDEPQWTAVVHRAAAKLPARRGPIFQYASRLYSVLDSARDYWEELGPNPKWNWKSKPLADHEVYALLAMDEAYSAAKSLIKLIRRFDEWADDEGVSRDADDYEALREEVSSWERREFRYAISQLAQAKDLQHLAHLAHLGADSVKALEYRESLERQVLQRDEELAAAKPLAETGKVFVEGRPKGGKANKGQERSVFGKAIKALCKEMKNYDPEEIVKELRKDCGDDEDVSGISKSERMNDLRERKRDPIRVRIQEVPDDISDRARSSLICFRDLNKNVEATITVGAFRNIISRAKPAELKASRKEVEVS